MVPGELACTVDVVAEGLRAERPPLRGAYVQQHAGHSEVGRSLLLLKDLLQILGKFTRAVSHKDDVGVLKPLLVDQAQGLPARRGIVRIAVPKGLGGEHILTGIGAWQKQVGLKLVRAGKVDEGKFALARHDDVLQREGHGLAPGGGRFCGTGFVQYADNVPAALVDGLPALILLERTALYLTQEQRDRLRRGQEGELGGEGTVQVVAQLQAVLLAPAAGVAVPPRLCQHLFEAVKIPGNLPERGALAHPGEELHVQLHRLGVVVCVPGAPRGQGQGGLLGLVLRRFRSLRQDGADGLAVFDEVVADDPVHRPGLLTLAPGRVCRRDDLAVLGGVRGLGVSGIQELPEGAHALVAPLFQHVKRVQSLFVSPGLLQQAIQVAGHLGAGFRRGLIGRELSALAGRLAGGVPATLHHAVHDVRIELPGDAGKLLGRVPADIQAVEGLVDVPGEIPEGGELGEALLLKCVHLSSLWRGSW